ncbi:MAG: glycosyltransferase family 2 protein [Prosthecobacter sp.]|nr:glycosyltransferase family 2 protein [Prosthecobacter sp.]
MNLADITPLVLTWNEAPNLERTLAALDWASQILVIDSGSTDGTLEMLAANTRVRVLHRKFDSFASQCNFGLKEVGTPWVLSLDADYVLTPELAGELASLEPAADVSGFSAAFDYWILGRPLSASLYPPRTVLYRRDQARYVDDGHCHKATLQGRVEALRARIAHDDRKPLSRWLASQDKYALLEAEKLLAVDPASLRMQDRLRRTGWAAVPATLIYTLLVKGTLLDGWRGWYYTLQRVLAEIVLALRLLEARLAVKK